jgi:hypothetical protein
VKGKIKIKGQREGRLPPLRGFRSGTGEGMPIKLAYLPPFTRAREK